MKYKKYLNTNILGSISNTCQNTFYNTAYSRNSSKSYVEICHLWQGWLAGEVCNLIESKLDSSLCDSVDSPIYCVVACCSLMNVGQKVTGYLDYDYNVYSIRVLSCDNVMCYEKSLYKT